MSQFYQSRYLPTPSSTTTTTTPVPPVDPYEYEKSISSANVTDAEIEKLKDHVRLDRGMLPSYSPKRKRVDVYKPTIAPRPNETSRIRMELRAFRLMQKCGGVVRKITDEEQRMLRDKQKRDQALIEMLRKAKQLTAEEVELEMERSEFERLRETVERTKVEGGFRGNLSSDMRYKHVRGEPILTTRFQDNYSNHFKPPFSTNVHDFPIVKRKLPAIDKDKEMWYWPVDDATDIGIPWKCEKVIEKRLSRQQLRPPLKAHERRRRTTTKEEDEPKKMPWNYGALSTPLLVGVRNTLFKERNGNESGQQDEHEEKTTRRAGIITESDIALDE